jgi:hypothetical protein
VAVGPEDTFKEIMAGLDLQDIFSFPDWWEKCSIKYVVICRKCGAMVPEGRTITHYRFHTSLPVAIMAVMGGVRLPEGSSTEVTDAALRKLNDVLKVLGLEIRDNKVVPMTSY